MIVIALIACSLLFLSAPSFCRRRANHRLVETGVQWVGVIARSLGDITVDAIHNQSPFLEISTGPPLSPLLIGFHLSVSFLVNTHRHGGSGLWPSVSWPSSLQGLDLRPHPEAIYLLA
jgi:hypothetical protein